MSEVVFIKTELAPIKKEGQHNILDILKCQMYRVDKNFTSIKTNIPFFPSELKSLPTLNLDQMENIVWRSLQLEDNLRRTREYLRYTKLIICYDKLTESFLKELLKSRLEDIIIQVIA